MTTAETIHDRLRSAAEHTHVRYHYDGQSTLTAESIDDALRTFQRAGYTFARAQTSGLWNITDAAGDVVATAIEDRDGRPCYAFTS